MLDGLAGPRRAVGSPKSEAGVLRPFPAAASRSLISISFHLTLLLDALIFRELDCRFLKNYIKLNEHGPEVQARWLVPTLCSFCRSCVGGPVIEEKQDCCAPALGILFK